jgi:hypothetical protein
MDGGLMRVLRGGTAALPNDLDRLQDYLSMTAQLLTEKATELEPSWAQARMAAAELETLLRLERQVAEKAADVPAASLREVLVKLDIWASLDPCDEEAPMEDGRDSLVRAARRDLARLMGERPARRPPVRSER